MQPPRERTADQIPANLPGARPFFSDGSRKNWPAENDSSLEGPGFEPAVPRLIDDAFDTAPLRLCGTSRSAGKTGSFLREGPAVRIRFPPAKSPLRTGSLYIRPPVTK